MCHRHLISSQRTCIFPLEPSRAGVVRMEFSVLEKSFFEESDLALVVIKQLTLVKPSNLKMYNNYYMLANLITFF